VLVAKKEGGAEPLARVLPGGHPPAGVQMLGRPLLDAEDPSPAPQTPLRWLLVVEDDPDHRETVREVLEEEGYRVDTAVHGRDALGRLSLWGAGHLPDLILLDLRMPVMDGWGFMAELKQHPVLASIPVVVTSCMGDRVLSSAPVAAGYLSKPLNRSRLLELISCCLWRQQRARAGRLSRVLLVGDESTIDAALARVLSREHDVVTVAGATAAAERLETGAQFDVILCDLIMPGTTGMELHARLSKEAPEQAARMIFMVGAEVTPEARSFLRDERPRWMEKPFTVTALDALQALIRGVAPPAART
jgi:CheY-like chemotaxis protein